MTVATRRRPFDFRVDSVIGRYLTNGRAVFEVVDTQGTPLGDELPTSSFGLRLVNLKHVPEDDDAAYELGTWIRFGDLSEMHAVEAGS